MKKEASSLMTAVLFVLLFAYSAVAQNTSFSYQGSLQSGGNPASGNHDFEFALFDALASGAQLGSVLSINNIVVSNGIFYVQLDFGNQFPGANRFLEIRVRPSGQPGMTVLAPRQLLNSSPYSVKSLTADNANSVGGQPAASVASAVLAVNSATQANVPNTLVIRNASGDISANTISAAQQYNIGVNRVLGTNGINNLFVGPGAGFSNTSGNNNAFVGTNSGRNNTEGSFNAFFGRSAGNDNTTGEGNSFFGNGSGRSNTQGSSNSFFGNSAGQSNTFGIRNSFFGTGTGLVNTTGSDNSFFGTDAGDSNTIGSFNSFFGRSAGASNTDGQYNSFFGQNAGLLNTTGSNNSFFGRNAGLSNSTGLDNSFFGVNAGDANSTASNNSFFGRSSGSNNSTGFNNSFFGRSSGIINSTGSSNSFFGYSAGLSNSGGNNNSFFGSGAGQANGSGDFNSFFGHSAGFSNTGSLNSFVGYAAGAQNTSGLSNAFFGNNSGVSNTTGDNNTLIGTNADVGSANLTYATAIGAGSVVPTSNTVVVGRAADIVRVPGFLRVNQLGAAGSTPLCQNVNGTISTCSSSRRYKTAVASFTSGLGLINRLRPVSFNWRDGGAADLGLVAEEVADVEPLLTTMNAKGEIEGVKYDRVAIVLVNAVKEQQAELESQRNEISDLRAQVDALKKLVCASQADAPICKEER